MENTDYIHGTFLLVTTEVDPDNFAYEEYVDECEVNGIEAKGSNSDEYWEWMEDITRDNFESDMDNIKYCKEYNVPCVITGHRGLWDGKHTIRPVRKESVYDAIMECYDGDGDVEVKFEDGKVVVRHSHHDGTNVFTIYALNEDGEQKFEDYEYEGTPFTLTEDDTNRLPYLYAI